MLFPHLFDLFIRKIKKNRNHERIFELLFPFFEIYELKTLLGFFFEFQGTLSSETQNLNKSHPDIL